VTIDDHGSAWLHASQFAAGMFAQGPLTQPPPPTGSLAPPPAPDLPVEAERPATDEQEPPAAHSAQHAQPTQPAQHAQPAQPANGVHLPEATQQPTEPVPLGAHLADGLRAEMLALLGRAGGQLQAVFDAYRAGATDPDAIVAAGAVPTEGAAADLLLRIRSILGELTAGPAGHARGAAGTIRTLLRAADLSRAARQYLTELRGQLLDQAESDVQNTQELALLEANSVVLQRALRTANGVAVHTYPHYWRHPYDVETNRRLLKIAPLSLGGWQQVLDQSQAAGTPEEPVLLRVYVAQDLAATERTFRRLLQAADHTRSTGDGGWFATTLEFLDEIARAIGVEIKAGTEPAL
jgi:hypothetical protein